MPYKAQFERLILYGCSYLGHYGIGTNRSCLVYTTFSNRILVYYNIQLKNMSPSNLLMVMSEEVSSLSVLYNLFTTTRSLCWCGIWHPKYFHLLFVCPFVMLPCQDVPHDIKERLDKLDGMYFHVCKYRVCIHMYVCYMHTCTHV